MPDVFIVGATKSATTTLYDILIQSPEIHDSGLKEPHYYFQKNEGVCFYGEADLDTIKQMFIKSENEYKKLYDSNRVTVDASAMYIESESALKNIKQDYPNALVVVMVRDPLQRAFSAYSHMIRDAREKLTFNEALVSELNGERESFLPIWKYIASSRYVDKIKMCDELFGENLIVYKYEDFIKDPNVLLKKICNKVDIEEFDFNLKHSNKSGVPKSAFIQKAIMRGSLFKRVFIKVIGRKNARYIKSKIQGYNVGAKTTLEESDKQLFLKAIEDQKFKIEVGFKYEAILKEYYGSN